MAKAAKKIAKTKLLRPVPPQSAEVLEAVARGRPSRLGGAFALHLTEATLAVATAGRHVMATTCEPLEPMPWAR